MNTITLGNRYVVDFDRIKAAGFTMLSVTFCLEHNVRLISSFTVVADKEVFVALPFNVIKQLPSIFDNPKKGGDNDAKET